MKKTPYMEAFTPAFRRVLREEPWQAAVLLSAIRGPDDGVPRREKLKSRFTWPIRKFVFTDNSMGFMGFVPGVTRWVGTDDPRADKGGHITTPKPYGDILNDIRNEPFSYETQHFLNHCTRAIMIIIAYEKKALANCYLPRSTKVFAQWLESKLRRIKKRPW